jgi:hypothetical protein
VAAPAPYFCPQYCKDCWNTGGTSKSAIDRIGSKGAANSQDVPINPGFQWTDPANNTARQAESWNLEFSYFDKQLNSNISFNFKTPHPGYVLSPSQYLNPTATYVWGVYQENRYGIGPWSPFYSFTTGPKKAPPPPPPPPPPLPPPAQLKGISKILFYNYSPNGYTVHFWTQDLATGAWKDWGSIADQANQPVPSYLEIDLEDKHNYTWAVVAIVPDDLYCSQAVNPDSEGWGNCWYWHGTALGDHSGMPVPLTYPPG